MPDYQYHLHLFLHYDLYPLCQQNGHYRTSLTKYKGGTTKSEDQSLVSGYIVADFKVVNFTNVGDPASTGEHNVHSTTEV